MVPALFRGDLPTLAGREGLDDPVESRLGGRRVGGETHDPEWCTVADPALDGVEVRRRHTDVPLAAGSSVGTGGPADS